MPEQVQPSYEILSCPDGREVTKMIERAARTCYKSETKIEGNSDLNLVGHLLTSEHLAMIEFGGDIVVKFVSNRGFLAELTRHRLCSFAVESTRYCAYNKAKYGKKISVIPVPDKWLRMDGIPATKRAAKKFRAAFEACEQYYMELTGMGVPAQIAREVLPIGLKTEICIKANIREWKHVLKLRCSKRAHPRMRQVCLPLLHELADRIPLLFDDLAEKYPLANKP